MLLDGSDAFENLEPYKAVIGYVPEEPHLYTYLTGPEYLRLIGRLRGLPEAARDDKIERSSISRASRPGALEVAA